MASLSRQQAISMLFSGLAADLESDEGATVTVQPSGMAGDTVWVTAPRLQVAGGLRLRGRLLDADGEPWIVSLVVDEADYHSHELARVRLRADAVTADASRRRSPRVRAGGIAWLTAVNCQHVVDADRVDGTMVDLSREGVAFATNRVLRPSDRLTFHGRFFADTVEAEVRVTSVREAASGRLIVGCAFIEIDAENQARVERLAGNAPAQGRPATTFSELRLLAADEEPEQGGWRRRFKR
jgi:PilZ domain-containing protein